MGHSECLAYGAIISFVVSFLKKIDFVKSHPKIVAALLSMVVAGLSVYLGDDGEFPLTILRCVVETFAVSIATHEAVVHPVKEKIDV